MYSLECSASFQQADALPPPILPPFTRRTATALAYAKLPSHDGSQRATHVPTTAQQCLACLYFPMHFLALPCQAATWSVSNAVIHSLSCSTLALFSGLVPLHLSIIASHKHAVVSLLDFSRFLPLPKPIPAIRLSTLLSCRSFTSPHT